LFVPSPKTRPEIDLEDQNQQQHDDDQEQRSSTDEHIKPPILIELPDEPAGSTPTRELIAVPDRRNTRANRKGCNHKGYKTARKRKDADNRFRSRRRQALKDLEASLLAEIRILGSDRPAPKRGFAGPTWLPELAL
jgi:hypothetical protein